MIKTALLETVIDEVHKISVPLHGVSSGEIRGGGGRFHR